MPEIFMGKTKDIPEVAKLHNSRKFESSLGSFVVKPKMAKFETQDDDEEVVILGRRHFFTNIKWITLACFAFFVPMFWWEFPMIEALDNNTALALSVVWYAGLLFYVIQNFILWFYNVYIVTNERVVDVDFFGLMYKNINVTEMNNVQDVNYSQRGIFSSFFNYGDVVVQTASEQRSDDGGEQSAFTFQAISNPDLVAKIISELWEKNMEEGRGNINNK